MNEESDGTVYVHLVLGAGGVLCLSFAGAIRALEENNIRPASISACSAGALIGALLATGKTAGELEQIVLSADLSGLGEPLPTSRLRQALKFFSMRRWPYALSEQSHVADLFKALVGDDPTFESLEIPFATAAMDLLAGRLLAYSKEHHGTLRVSEALRVATAIPFLYPPYEQEGRVIVDAAVATQLPVWLVSGREQDLPIVTIAPTKPQQMGRPRSLPDYIQTLLNAGVTARDHYQFAQMPRLRSIQIPTGNIDPLAFDLSLQERRSLIDRGRETAREAIKRWGPKLDVTPQFEIPPSVREINDDLARAEAFGDERMAGFYARVGKTAGKRVFLSYSHDDGDWHQRFKTHVSPLVEGGALQLWDDTNIGMGTRWNDAIERALETSQAAILLVSANFLASTYVMEKELPYLSEAARQRGLILMWLLVSDCLFRETALADYQCLNNPEVPLDQLSPGDREKALANTARLIKRDLGL